MNVRVTVLGCGTSVGVPVIGCDCPVCTSDDPRNRRLRTGLWVETGDHSVLIDTTIDLRQQALLYGIDRVDAVLYTHAHADHILGVDDMRIFSYRQKAVIPCYGNAAVVERFGKMFSYLFNGATPKLSLHEIGAEPFELAGLTWQPIPVRHGRMEVYGYRLGPFAYVTDTNRIPASSLELLRGVRILVLGALRWGPESHPTHFTVEEALAVAREVGAARTCLTHMNHEVDAQRPKFPLPEGVEFAHDGLEFRLDL